MKNIIIDPKTFIQILNSCDDQELRDFGFGLVSKAENPMLPIQEFCSKLTRPLVIFDCETTGTNPSVDRVVSIDYTKIFPDGNIEKRSFLIDPTIQIPEGASAIHGISDDDVLFCPTFCEKSETFLSDLSNCDLGTFNGNKFDIPLLMEEFNRCGVIWPEPDQLRIDVSQIYREKNRRSLMDAHIQYLGFEFEGAHDSGADVEATKNVLLAMLNEHDDLAAMDLQQLHDLSKSDPNQVDIAGKLVLINGVACYNFGKNKGVPVINDKGYAAWMRDADFPAETKRQLEYILEKENAFN